MKNMLQILILKVKFGLHIWSFPLVLESSEIYLG